MTANLPSVFVPGETTAPATIGALHVACCKTNASGPVPGVGGPGSDLGIRQGSVTHPLALLGELLASLQAQRAV